MSSSFGDQHCEDDDNDVDNFIVDSDKYETGKIGKLRRERECIQAKTYKNWINSLLIRAHTRISDIYTDLSSGVNLLTLLELITDKRIGTPSKGSTYLHKIENVSKCLKFIKDNNIYVESIGPEDIVDGNQRLTLGLIWTIILRFQLSRHFQCDQQDIKTVRESLLLWCQLKTKNSLRVKIKDFNKSWKSGWSFVELIDSLQPGLIDTTQLEGWDNTRILEYCFDLAHRHLGVPPILDARDVNNSPDDNCVLTYVSYFYNLYSKSITMEANQQHRIEHFIEKKQAIDNLESRLTEDAKQFVQSIRDKCKTFEAPVSLDKSNKEMSSFQQYFQSERTKLLQLRNDLEATFFELRTQKSQLGGQSVSNQGLLNQISQAWRELEECESRRSNYLKERMTINKQLAKQADQLNTQTVKIEHYIADKFEQLNRIIKHDRCQTMEAFSQFLQQSELTCQDILTHRVDLSKDLEPLKANNHHELPMLELSIHQINNKMALLKKMAANNLQNIEITKRLLANENRLNVVKEEVERLERTLKSSSPVAQLESSPLVLTHIEKLKQHRDVLTMLDRQYLDIESIIRVLTDNNNHNHLVNIYTNTTCLTNELHEVHQTISQCDHLINDHNATCSSNLELNRLIEDLNFIDQFLDEKQTLCLTPKDIDYHAHNIAHTQRRNNITKLEIKTMEDKLTDIYRRGYQLASKCPHYNHRVMQEIDSIRSKWKQTLAMVNERTFLIADTINLFRLCDESNDLEHSLTSISQHDLHSIIDIDRDHLNQLYNLLHQIDELSVTFHQCPDGKKIVHLKRYHPDQIDLSNSHAYLNTSIEHPLFHLNSFHEKTLKTIVHNLDHILELKNMTRTDFDQDKLARFLLNNNKHSYDYNASNELPSSHDLTMEDVDQITQLFFNQNDGPDPVVDFLAKRNFLVAKDLNDLERLVSFTRNTINLMNVTHRMIQASKEEQSQEAPEEPEIKEIDKESPAKEFTFKLDPNAAKFKVVVYKMKHNAEFLETLLAKPNDNTQSEDNLLNFNVNFTKNIVMKSVQQLGQYLEEDEEDGEQKTERKQVLREKVEDLTQKHAQIESHVSTMNFVSNIKRFMDALVEHSSELDSLYYSNKSIQVTSNLNTLTRIDTSIRAQLTQLESECDRLLEDTTISQEDREIIQLRMSSLRTSFKRVEALMQRKIDLFNREFEKELAKLSSNFEEISKIETQQPTTSNHQSWFDDLSLKDDKWCVSNSSHSLDHSEADSGHCDGGHSMGTTPDCRLDSHERLSSNGYLEDLSDSEHQHVAGQSKSISDLNLYETQADSNKCRSHSDSSIAPLELANRSTLSNPQDEDRNLYEIKCIFDNQYFTITTQISNIFNKVMQIIREDQTQTLASLLEENSEIIENISNFVKLNSNESEANKLDPEHQDIISTNNQMITNSNIFKSLTNFEQQLQVISINVTSIIDQQHAETFDIEEIFEDKDKEDAVSGEGKKVKKKKKKKKKTKTKVSKERGESTQEEQLDTRPISIEIEASESQEKNTTHTGDQEECPDEVNQTNREMKSIQLEDEPTKSEMTSEVANLFNQPEESVDQQDETNLENRLKKVEDNFKTTQDDLLMALELLENKLSERSINKEPETNNTAEIIPLEEIPKGMIQDGRKRKLNDEDEILVADQSLMHGSTKQIKQNNDKEDAVSEEDKKAKKKKKKKSKEGGRDEREELTQEQQLDTQPISIEIELTQLEDEPTRSKRTSEVANLSNQQEVQSVDDRDHQVGIDLENRLTQVEDNLRRTQDDLLMALESLEDKLREQMIKRENEKISKDESIEVTFQKQPKEIKLGRKRKWNDDEDQPDRVDRDLILGSIKQVKQNNEGNLWTSSKQDTTFLEEKTSSSLSVGNMPEVNSSADSIEHDLTNSESDVIAQTTLSDRSHLEGEEAELPSPPRTKKNKMKKSKSKIRTMKLDNSIKLITGIHLDLGDSDDDNISSIFPEDCGADYNQEIVLAHEDEETHATHHENGEENATSTFAPSLTEQLLQEEVEESIIQSENLEHLEDVDGSSLNQHIDTTTHSHQTQVKDQAEDLTAQMMSKARKKKHKKKKKSKHFLGQKLEEKESTEYTNDPLDHSDKHDQHTLKEEIKDNSLTSNLESDQQVGSQHELANIEAEIHEKEALEALKSEEQKERLLGETNFDEEQEWCSKEVSTVNEANTEESAQRQEEEECRDKATEEEGEEEDCSQKALPTPLDSPEHCDDYGRHYNNQTPMDRQLEDCHQLHLTTEHFEVEAKEEAEMEDDQCELNVVNNTTTEDEATMVNIMAKDDDNLEEEILNDSRAEEILDEEKVTRNDRLEPNVDDTKTYEAAIMDKEINLLGSNLESDQLVGSQDELVNIEAEIYEKEALEEPKCEENNEKGSLGVDKFDEGQEWCSKDVSNVNEANAEESAQTTQEEEEKCKDKATQKEGEVEGDYPQQALFTQLDSSECSDRHYNNQTPIDMELEDCHQLNLTTEDAEAKEEVEVIDDQCKLNVVNNTTTVNIMARDDDKCHLEEEILSDLRAKEEILDEHKVVKNDQFEPNVIGVNNTKTDQAAIMANDDNDNLKPVQLQESRIAKPIIQSKPKAKRKSNKKTKKVKFAFDSNENIVCDKDIELDNENNTQLEGPDEAILEDSKSQHEEEDISIDLKSPSPSEERPTSFGCILLYCLPFYALCLLALFLLSFIPHDEYEFNCLLRNEYASDLIRHYPNGQPPI